MTILLTSRLTIQPFRRRMDLASWRLIAAATAWHVTSQQGSRRNALVASTALTQRRCELLDVEEFLAAHEARAARADQIAQEPPRLTRTV